MSAHVLLNLLKELRKRDKIVYYNVQKLIFPLRKSVFFKVNEKAYKKLQK